MTWTPPRTWANNEVPDQTIFNTHIRDNLLALAERNRSRVVHSTGTGSSATNSGVSLSWTTPTTVGFPTNSSGVIDADALAAFNSTLQFRVSLIVDVITICPGSPSAVNVNAGYQVIMQAGVAAAPGTYTRWGGTLPFANTTGLKTVATPWRALPWSSGLLIVKFGAELTRTGGTNGGEARVYWIVEVRNG